MISDLLCFLLEEEYGKLAKVLYGFAEKREIRMYIPTHGTPLSTIERSVRRTVAPKVAGRPLSDDRSGAKIENITTKAIKCDMIFTSEYGQGGMNPCICDRWDLTLEWIRRYYEGITDKESIARMGPGD